MTADDAAWAAGLMERHRQVYAGYSPVFWRPQPAPPACTHASSAATSARPATSPCAPGVASSSASAATTRGSSTTSRSTRPARGTATRRRGPAEPRAPVRRSTASSGADSDLARRRGQVRHAGRALASVWPSSGASVSCDPARSRSVPPRGRLTGTGFAGLLGPRADRSTTRWPGPARRPPGGRRATWYLVEREAAGDGGRAADRARRARHRTGPGRSGPKRPGWTVASDWYLGRPG